MFWEATLTRRIAFHVQLLFRSVWFAHAGMTLFCAQDIAELWFLTLLQASVSSLTLQLVFKHIVGRICMQMVRATVADRDVPRTFQKNEA